ncbi:kinase-like protein [Rhizophagus irregularis]|uniref:Kinase-like protein n=2 Tax=Rhizophagus irregularis TaxID=588596 RepID=A0A2N0S9M3_9GLOM|nr:kinase-like protein [Rhizophagus irregularis]
MNTTPKSPVLFLPFKNNEKKCNYCEIKYSKLPMYNQKYCINCSYCNTNNPLWIKHEATRSIYQKWCEHYFSERVVTRDDNYWSETCDISSGWVESILTKKSILILYLSWWDSHNQCVVCHKELKYIHQKSNQKSNSYCQKWCSHCFIIYTGCRHCLTTNIIFGIADQSQCKKCKRISFIRIDITNIRSGNYIIEEFLVSTRIKNDNFHSIANYINNKTIYNPTVVYSYIYNEFRSSAKKIVEWIPYSQFTNLKKIAEGGFSIIYKATWKGTNVAIKKLRDSQIISKHFFNELRSLYQCNDNNRWIIGFNGITQDPITKENMLILNYAEGGNLHDYLQKNFINLSWADKLLILRGISFGLDSIHKKDFIHRDFHSGNMLFSEYWRVGDLGLSQPANNTLSNNEIYGVIPYIAPEIFKGAAFSKESDIYSLGMIMWELTTGCKPFVNVEHDHNLIFKILDGERPKITEDTPECYADLMKKCWDSDPSKRPTIGKIRNSILDWPWPTTINFQFETIMQFEQAEKKRLELIQLKKLGPEFSEKPHPKAIYTSRALSDLISKASTIGSFNIKQEYITQEYEFDIDNIQRSSIQNTNSATQSLIVPVNSSRKRNFEELKNETNENQKNRKYTKVDNLNDELLNIIELI